jgi:hypothetical protein
MSVCGMHVSCIEQIVSEMPKAQLMLEVAMESVGGDVESFGHRQILLSEK